MRTDNKKIKNRYNGIAKIYNLLEKPMESMIMSKWMDKLIERIEGEEILEVGVGAGKNLIYYPDTL